MNAKRVVSILMLAGFSFSAAAQSRPPTREGEDDRRIQTQVSEELQKKKQFREIAAEVEEGVVTLTGEVDLYIDKINAERRARKVRNVDGVRNRIRVGGDAVEDADLRESLANKLRYDRVGQGIIFNSLTVSVVEGTVVVGGNVRDYPDRESALAIVQTTPGVKDVVDDIEVAPLSSFDDRLRVSLARAIYGQPSLQKYALDPQAPIRIVVENGNVEIFGVVLNAADRQIAETQARSVPGSFSVKNNLMIASNATR